MTMFKYESDEVYKHVRGETTPQIPVYYSEILYDLIQEAKPNYPQLSDYEKEWVHFSMNDYNAGEPVDLEYQTIENVSEATVYNSIPYYYKSAILKGQTLKNLCPQKTAECSGNNWKFTTIILDSVLFKANSTYYFDVICSNTNDIVANIEKIWFVIVRNNSNTTIAKTNSSTTFTIPSDYNNTTDVVQIRIHCSAGNSATNTITCDNMMIFDYYDGIELKTFPYVEYGVHSVIMPFLRTSNEDGTKTNTVTCNEDVTLRGIGDDKDELNLLTGELIQRIEEVVIDGSTISLTNNTSYMSEDSTAVITSALPSISLNKTIMCNNLPTYVAGNSIWNKNSGVTTGVSFVSNIWGFCIRLPHSVTGVTTEDTETTVKQKFKTYLHSNPLTIHYPLGTESINTVALSHIPKPYEGTTHLESNALIYLECPVVSTGEQTLYEINSLED